MVTLCPKGRIDFLSHPYSWLLLNVAGPQRSFCANMFSNKGNSKIQHVRPLLASILHWPGRGMGQGLFSFKEFFSQCGSDAVSVSVTCSDCDRHWASCCQLCSVTLCPLSLSPCTKSHEYLTDMMEEEMMSLLFQGIRGVAVLSPCSCVEVTLNLPFLGLY